MKLIILDRDGVINQDSKDYIRGPKDWEPIPESLPAIARLTQAGFRVAIATNQAGIGRGYYTDQDLEAIHAKMHLAVENCGGKIDWISYCPHAPDANCACRKPKPGLLHQIFDHFGITALEEPIYFIGDSLRDLEAAIKVHCIPLLVLTGNGIKTAAQLPSHLAQVQQFQDLAAAVSFILDELTA
jgi:D-glycero-D-manno-heptose 1,7-bisphosphate phosphatase